MGKLFPFSFSAKFIFNSFITIIKIFLNGSKNREQTTKNFNLLQLFLKIFISFFLFFILFVNYHNLPALLNFSLLFYLSVSKIFLLFFHYLFCCKNFCEPSIRKVRSMKTRELPFPISSHPQKMPERGLIRLHIPSSTSRI